MPNYTFTFKKDDIFVEFKTTDKFIVDRQFQIWVDSASEYTKTHPAKTEEKKTLNQPELKPQASQPVSQPQAAPSSTIVPQAQAAEVPQQSTEVAEEETEPEQRRLETQSNHAVEEQKIQTPVHGVTPEPLISHEPIQERVEDIQAASLEEPTAVELESKPEIITEHVIQVVEEVPKTASRTINSIQSGELEPLPESNGLDFEKVLESSLENPTFEPVSRADSRFLELFNSKQTNGNKLTYLIITAYYLSEFEKMERFSIKQINSKLMQNISELIDHTVLQDAINKNLIALVPDLTGVSDVAEYKITEFGEAYFVNGLK